MTSAELYSKILATVRSCICKVSIATTDLNFKLGMFSFKLPRRVAGYNSSWRDAFNIVEHRYKMAGFPNMDFDKARELFSKGARLWLPDKEHVWKAAEVVEDFAANNLKVECDDGEQVTLAIKSKDDLPPLRNPEILIGENDLTSLSYLNEPEVLYNLRVRFCNHNAIYTYCGIVLVAINPYEELSIYGEDTIRAYRGQSMGDLDPHIFAVAEESFTKVEREEQNQSIIVSGESGAGKTVSAKYAMRYFATVGGSATETQVERKVLASNPIMEAIGNAKTTRNDNSSRFGKYIEIDFNKQFTIIGANMRTYLLEKSRVVFQAPEERNYHIFYQLCASSHLEEFKDLQLSHHRKFRYTNFGESGAIPGVDDAEYFQETKNALTTLGFSASDQKMMFRILAAILHLGNVAIVSGLDTEQGEEEGCGISMKDQHLHVVAELLGIDEEQMRTWLCFRKIVSQREVFTKPMTVPEAVFARDALAKHVYARLFAWTVFQVNKSLASSSKPYKFIGVLDIYGFETFEVNSFEQFCINYANEKLQQQFNQHVFKLEQEEYVKEKIEWKFIDFYDNQPCIDLIESKLGILDLLDEECRMPKGSDQTWVQKLYEKCTKWKHFSKPRLSNSAFLVTHFADIVQYESSGFLVKNRDTVMDEHINILKASQYELVGELFKEETVEAKPKGSMKTPLKSQHSTGTTQKQHKRTVGCQFVDSLSLLMNTLNSTTPHYVRCIKPNDDKMSFEFDPHRAVQQLRACGVLETIRISAAGFPSRWTYQDFFIRYRVLIPSKFINRGDLRTTSEKILSNLIKDADKFQFGKTKIFFRAGQVAYLEKLRSDKMKACCIIIQKRIKGWLQRKRYLKLRNCVLNLQRYSRGLLARRKALFMRQTRAAICIQRRVRGYIQRTKYKTICHAVLRLQCYARGRFAREHFQTLRREHAAVVIQKWVRGWLARVQYKKAIVALILLQSCVRRLIAKRELKQLKIEARSVEHVKKLNLGLENKIISMQQKIEEMTKEMNSLRLKNNEYNELRSKMDEFKSAEIQAQKHANTIVQLEEKLKDITEQLQKERAEKMDILNEKDRKEKENVELLGKNVAEIALLKEDLMLANDAIKARNQELEETIHLKVESERKLLLQEFDEERRAYQKLLKENARLEQRYENLEGEVSRLRGHRRTPSNVSLQSMSTDVIQDASEASSVLLDNMEDDGGYGSVRSQKSSRLRVENPEWDQMTPSEDGSVAIGHVPVPKYEDITLVLKLQQKLNEVTAENDRLRKKLEALENRADQSPKDDAERMKDLMRLQELEMETSKQKDNIRRFMAVEKDGISALQKESLIQFDALQEELMRRREECVQLRTILANRTQEMKQIAYESYGGEVEIINEDGELLVAYEGQKSVLKQLENEVQELKIREGEYRMELKKLQGDNERQQKLISQNLKKTPQAQVEAVMQHEITRLTSENLDLRERNDALSEQVRKLKKQLKIYAKKLKESVGSEPQQVQKMDASMEGQHNMPVVKHKTADYLGMFEYRREDESALIKGLIYDLKPRVSITLLPGLPAYILFMCIRHTDHINDDEKVRSLLTNTVNSIKRIIKKRRDDLDITIMWLATVCRLLHNLKQYSGDVAFQSENTPKQNEQCLRHFDLSEYRQVLSDIAVWIYQGVIKIMEEKVQPLIIPAVLEHEAIPGIAANKPLGLRGRSSSIARELESPVDPQLAVQNLLKELTGFHLALSMHGVDPELIRQVVKQLMYFICAGALNNLLLRKDLCHWSKGMQIRYNLSHLEQWFRDQKLHDGGVIENLSPIIQASQLLQARKTDEDVQTICDMCDKLTVAQIIKILNLYTPADEFEERVPMAFIRKIQQQLSERAEGQQQLLMDTKFNYPVRFPFNPSNIRLEDITVPDILNLPMLKKI